MMKYYMNNFQSLWNISHEKVHSLIQVDIFYPESSSLVAETMEKTSVSNFVASIGGAMGKKEQNRRDSVTVKII